MNQGGRRSRAPTSHSKIDKNRLKGEKVTTYWKCGNCFYKNKFQPNRSKPIFKPLKKSLNLLPLELEDDL